MTILHEGTLFQSDFFQNALLLGQGILVLAVAFTLVSFVLGPHAQDRIMSFDMLYHIIMLLFISHAIKYQSTFYFDIALMLGLLGFVASVALAKFLMRGEVIE